MHLGSLVVGNHQHHLPEFIALEPSVMENLLRCRYDRT